MASVRLDNVTKVYAGGVPALEDLTLEVADGEFAVLLGPSGCGKSTALRLIAGLERPTRGRIWIGDRDVTDRPARERDIAMVFQSYALYPHKTVEENLAFGLRMRRVPRAEIAARVRRAAEMLGIAELLHRRPGQLSGGQRQRVALGRALVRDPQAFLLDEPLSNLDARLRLEMRAEIARLHRRTRATMLYVTHDQEEAMTLGRKVAVLRAGRLEQVGTPQEIYHQPASVFVAGFVGSPPMNLFSGRVGRAGGDLVWERAGLKLALPGAPVREGPAVLGIRPHEIEVLEAGEGPSTCEATVELLEPLGASTLLRTRSHPGGLPITVSVTGDVDLVEGTRIGLRFRRGALHLFDAATGLRIPQRENPPRSARSPA